MYLTSALEPGGPKSKAHYLVLHNNSQRDLVKLPESYADLQKLVKRLYQIEPDQFYIETQELNLCAGEKIKIPEDVWDDVAQLLGNINVVQCGGDAANAANPETPGINSSQNLNQGVISLAGPLLKDEIIVTNLGDINFQANLSSTTEFNVQLLNEKKEKVFTATFFPLTEAILLTSTNNAISITCSLEQAFSLSAYHHVAICKTGSQYQLWCDLHLIGSVNAPAHFPPTFVAYDLGIHSPIQGPVSANIYPNLSQLRDKHPLMVPPIEREHLYQQILACDPSDAPRILGSLATIRLERTSLHHSGSIRVWNILPSIWANFEWDFGQRSFCVIRFHYPQVSPIGALRRCVFGPPFRCSLHILIESDNIVNFMEYTGNNKYAKFHSIRLQDTIQPATDHSITIVNHGGQLHVIFDFIQSTILPQSNSDVVIQKPDRVLIDGQKCSVDALVYG